MVRKLLTMAAGAALVISPVAAQAAAPLSVAHSSDVRAAAGMDDASGLRGSNAPVFIGFILVILLLAIVTADGRDEPSNSP